MNFKDHNIKIIPALFLDVGNELEFEVLGYHEKSREIWLRWNEQ